MQEGAQVDMALALERPLAPAVASPEHVPSESHESKLDVIVVFTSTESTLKALKEAGALAERLAARVTLLVPQIVPYPLPLTSPPVLLAFNERRFHGLAADSRVPTNVRIYLCRDRWSMLNLILKPHSLVVVGGTKHWWPTPETHLARRLRRSGHQVILVETE